MKKFKVNFSYEERGTCLVEAKTRGEAEHRLREYLAEEGICELEFSCQDRDYSADTYDEVDESLVADLAYSDFVPFSDYEEEEGDD